MKILVIEDDEISWILLKIAIEPLASICFHSITGLEAIEICRKNPVLDLVLMDIQLPDIDGYKAIKIVREFNAKLVVIAQAAFTPSGDRAKAIKTGCNDHISKPIKLKALTKMIRSHIFHHEALGYKSNTNSENVEAILNYFQIVVMPI